MALTSAAATEVQKNFGAFHDRALAAPVRVTKYGRETVYIISAQMFHELKQGQRQSIAAVDLSEDDMSRIATAEIPLEHRRSTKNLR
jgi:prevent-host-death family protein